MGTCVYVCGCSVTTSMFRCGDYERPVINVTHCLKHAVNTIQQNLLVRMVKELDKLTASENSGPTPTAPPV